VHEHLEDIVVLIMTLNMQKFIVIHILFYYLSRYIFFAIEVKILKYKSSKFFNIVTI